MFWRVVSRSFWIRKKRIALAILAVVLGASLASALINVYLDITDQVGKELRSYGANIVVEPKGAALPLEIAGVNYGTVGERNFLKEDELYKIKKIFWKYNIVGFAPYLKIPVETVPGGPSLVLTGTWFAKELEVPDEAFKTFTTGVKTISPWWQVEGNWVQDGDLSGAMVGAGVARRLRLGIGDALTVRYGDKSLELKVAGIVDTGGEEDNQVFVNLPAVQQLAGLPGKVAQLKVSALITPDDALAKKDPQTMTSEEYIRWYCTPYIDAIVFQIEEVLTGADAKPIRQIAQAEGNLLAKVRIMLLLVTLAALMASAFGVMTVMTTNVLERRREIGIIKAIGADTLQVVSLFLGEAGLIGMAGGLFGYLIGILLARQIGLSVFEAAVTPDLKVLPITVAIALGVALVGVSFPVRRALLIQPVVVLRGE